MFKRLIIMSFYAVAKGRQPGIFESWPECQTQTKGFSGAVFKKFKTQREAQKYIDDKILRAPEAKRQKFTHKVNFCTESNKILAKKPKETVEESSLDEKFDNFPEFPDEPTTSNSSETSSKNPVKAPKVSRKLRQGKSLDATNQNSTALSKADKKPKKNSFNIPFEPPGPTVVKCYNGHTFNEDAKGFVHVYTDGSCENNGQSIAAAGFGVYFGENHELNVSEPVTGRPTNNVGEIQAAIRAIRDAQINGVKRLNIFTDSQFMIKSVCFWIKGWKKKNWVTGAGKPVANMVDFKRLDELVESGNMVIQWSYIPAHKGYDGNEKADQLAKIGASIYRTNRRIAEEDL